MSNYYFLKVVSYGITYYYLKIYFRGSKCTHVNVYPFLLCEKNIRFIWLDFITLKYAKILLLKSSRIEKGFYFFKIYFQLSNHTDVIVYPF